MTFFGPLSHIVTVSSQRTHFRRVGDWLVVLHFDVHRGRWAHVMKTSEFFEIAQQLFFICDSEPNSCTFTPNILCWCA